MSGTSILRDRARKLRQDQTETEHRLWSRLRARQVNGAKFRRQHVIGPYIVDFCCIENRLVVEVDGSQHTRQPETDRRRTSYLEGRGYRVLRFWDNEVMCQLEAVLEKILHSMSQSDAASPASTHACLPPRRREVNSDAKR